MFENTLDFIKSLYPEKREIPLHEPVLGEKEKSYLIECIDSGFVSSVGEFVVRAEKTLAEKTQSPHCVVTMNGTAALQLALITLDIKPNDEVICPAISFVATAAAIVHAGAHPVFLDAGKDSLNLDPEELEEFLSTQTERRDDGLYNKKTNRRIFACIPVHIFGHPCEMDKISKICASYNLKVIEDAAESVGSYYQGRHTGNFGDIGTLSFNGNKIITAGGGGALLFQNEHLSKKAKHLSTTAKLSHKWDFIHDSIGYNFRMPNLNAALLVAQLDQLSSFLEIKRVLARRYKQYCAEHSLQFYDEPAESQSNFWLNAIVLKDANEKEVFLTESHKQGIFARPLWMPLPHLKPYSFYQNVKSENAMSWYERVVNIPSGVNGFSYE